MAISAGIGSSSSSRVTRLKFPICCRFELGGRVSLSCSRSRFPSAIARGLNFDRIFPTNSMPIC